MYIYLRFHISIQLIFELEFGLRCIRVLARKMMSLWYLLVLEKNDKLLTLE